ncbi:unnamed protein product [Prunus armeniaca]
MPTEDSQGTQHHTPHEGTSQSRPSADANLQAELESLHASVTKMSKKYDYLPAKNEPERTQPNQPVPSHHSARIQPSLSKGKGPLHPETTKLRLLSISSSRDRPHEPVKVYRDCRDRILDRQPDPVPIPVNLQDPKMTHLGPRPKPTHLSAGEGAYDSKNWGAPAHPHLRLSTPEPLPHAYPAMRLLFEKVRRVESEQQRNHQPLWAKPRPRPFTERILNYHQDKDIQPLRIAFYTGTKDPFTHIHSFQSALGCKGLTDEGMCLLFPSTLSGAALNWFYRLNPRTINSFDSLKQAFLDHFMIQTDRLYSADDLNMLRQGEEEPIREYAARFSHEYSRCLETDGRAAFGAFKSGLRESNFRYLVHSNPWNTYAELMKQAAAHAKAMYFNSKRSPATLARNPFADPPPASIPILAPP